MVWHVEHCARANAGAGGGVGGIIGLLPSDEVAAGSAASRGSNLQIVVIGDVAVGAGVDLAGGGVLVQILKRESRGIVVPGRNPIGGGVARGALGGGEPSGNVIGDSAADVAVALYLSWWQP